MLPTITQLRAHLKMVVDNKKSQGHVVAGIEETLASVPDSYDALAEFAQQLAALPLRDDWPYVEPNDLESIWAECDPARPLGRIAKVDLADSARRVETAFLSSVCGCILGKPLEINPTLDQLKSAFETTGEWPINDYVSEKLQTQGLLRFHGDYRETVRERIRWAAPDDDINYRVIGMLLLEQHGLKLNRGHIRNEWLRNIAPWWSWGPERTMIMKATLDSLGNATNMFDDWVHVLNPNDEACGAMIRADVYGYACPGQPALAAELAWRDAGWTHQRTGIYGTMFVAAAISAAQVLKHPLDIFATAMQFVPRRSRFCKVVADSLNEVSIAKDWLDGYYRIHGKYKEYNHCQIYQESGTLINSLRFAENIGDGFCKQVMQGNDTDSYGATAGSILGAFFGPGHLEERWLRPFQDKIHVALATFHEQSLSALARRMSQLPAKMAGEQGTVIP